MKITCGGDSSVDELIYPDLVHLLLYIFSFDFDKSYFNPDEGSLFEFNDDLPGENDTTQVPAIHINLQLLSQFSINLQQKYKPDSFQLIINSSEEECKINKVQRPLRNK